MSLPLSFDAHLAFCQHTSFEDIFVGRWQNGQEKNNEKLIFSDMCVRKEERSVALPLVHETSFCNFSTAFLHNPVSWILASLGAWACGMYIAVFPNNVMLMLCLTALLQAVGKIIVGH